MRHVGSALFAVIVCRKFATVAAFSWHLPHLKNAAGSIVGEAEIVAQMVKGQREGLMGHAPSPLRREFIIASLR
jgi:hypothetical protein